MENVIKMSFDLASLSTYEICTLFLSGLLIFLTLVYSLFTYALFSESKKMRKLQTDPNMSVYLTCVPSSLLMKNIVIKNIGQGPAYNINFKTSPDFTIFDGQSLKDINLLKMVCLIWPRNLR
jgi:hypothetical protein